MKGINRHILNNIGDKLDNEEEDIRRQIEIIEEMDQEVVAALGKLIEISEERSIDVFDLIEEGGEEVNEYFKILEEKL